MTIRVFLSGTCEQPCETYEWTGTIAGFFASKGLAYTLAELPKSHVTVNGQALSMLEWADRHLAADDDVEVRLIQHGGVFSGLGKLLGSIFNFAFGWLMPKSGSQNYGSPEQGQRLETTSAKANQAKLGDVVPELAGRFRRFPDYLTPPRRRFVNWREQWLEFHACIGPGQYQIHNADVKVGDTPFSALGADGSYAIYGPGADLSGTSTHEHWHTVPAGGGVPALASCHPGDPAYPDLSTTLLIEVASLDAGAAVTLTGPGIQSRQALRAAGLPDGFWRDWRINHQRFPLGVDVFLTHGRQLCALPRSTRVES